MSIAPALKLLASAAERSVLATASDDRASFAAINALITFSLNESDRMRWAAGRQKGNKWRVSATIETDRELTPVQ